MRWTRVLSKKGKPVTDLKGFKQNTRSTPGLMGAYESALAAAPVLTKCATGGALAFMGDLVAQRVNNQQKGELQFNERRLTAFTVRAPTLAKPSQQQQQQQQQRARSARSVCSCRRAAADADRQAPPHLTGLRRVVDQVFGVGWTGLFNHYWFGWLARVIPGAGVTAVIGKTVVQHGFCNPVLYLPLFYAFNGAATGLDSGQIVDKAQAEYWPTLTKLWTIWVPSTALQFFLGARRWPVPLAAAPFAAPTARRARCLG